MLTLQYATSFSMLIGGLGTFEELAEVLSWRQLSIHEKPIVIFNVEGYWNPLLSFVESGQKSGFVSTDFLKTVCVTDSPNEAMQYIRNYRPKAVDKSEIYNGEMIADWAQAPN